MPVKWM